MTRSATQLLRSRAAPRPLPWAGLGVLATAAAGFVLLVWANLAAAAELTAQEQTYLTYQTGIRAVTECRKDELSVEDHEKLGARINSLTNHAVGAGRRLTLIEQAKRDVYRQGCDSDTVKAGLASYDADLATALQ